MMAIGLPRSVRTTSPGLDCLHRARKVLIDLAKTHLHFATSAATRLYVVT
jgi:hypothetical protein